MLIPPSSGVLVWPSALLLWLVEFGDYVGAVVRSSGADALLLSFGRGLDDIGGWKVPDDREDFDEVRRLREVHLLERTWCAVDEYSSVVSIFVAGGRDVATAKRGVGLFVVGDDVGGLAGELDEHVAAGAGDERGEVGVPTPGDTFFAGDAVGLFAGDRSAAEPMGVASDQFGAGDEEFEAAVGWGANEGECVSSGVGGRRVGPSGHFCGPFGGAAFGAASVWGV